MCTITEQTSKQGPVTAYKVAVKRDGRYYSMSTGVEYKVGPVPDLPKDSRPLSPFMKPVRKSESFYNCMMRGSTACFTELKDANDFARSTLTAHRDIEKAVADKNERPFGMLPSMLDWIVNTFHGLEIRPDIAVIEVALDDLTFYGEYDGAPVIMGKAIIGIKEIEEPISIP